MMFAAHASFATTVHAQDMGTRYEFHIEAESLGTALDDFVEQTGLMVLFPRELADVEGMSPVIGSFSAGDALDQLFMGTAFSGGLTKNGAIFIAQQKTNREEEMASGKLKKGLLASVAAFVFGGANAQDVETISDEAVEKEEEKDVIIVTGTNIRGITNPASPVDTFDRGDIALTGQLTVPDFLQTLPQNFLGSQTDFSVAIPGANSGNNLSQGSGINLRGLGSDSTLILLNGRRLAPGSVGNFVDVSNIPLSAVERIDVVTDGASAIYGSDAVGGVINIILLDDYDGAETSVRYGTVTDGDSEEFTASQLLGTSWDTGNALITYEYFNQTPLSNLDRDFVEDAAGEFFLAPKQKRHSVFLNASQDISPAIELRGTANYSSRDALTSGFSGAGQNTQESSSEQYGATLGLEFDLGSSWSSEIYGLFSRSSTDSLLVIPAFDFESPTELTSTIWSVETKANGPIFTLPAGESQLAIGGGFRKEKFEDVLGFTRGPTTSDRNVYFAFGEALLPIVGEANNMPGLRILELSVAGRFEDYSDAGSSTNGKIGLIWSPFNGLIARGTYGTSFRAPNFFEQPPGGSGILFIDVPDPLSPTGTSLLLNINGKFTDSLLPEHAETITVGFDFQPEQVPGLSVSLTYFDIDFTDRIGSPSANIFSFLGDPAFDSIIVRNPSLTEVEALLATTNVTSTFDFSGIADEMVRNSSVDVISDLRTANLAATRTSGFDFSVGYNKDTGIGNIGIRMAGSYLTRQEERVAPTSPAANLLNTRRNPVDLRLRNSVTWSNKGWNAGAFVNYTDSYTNDDVDPNQPIDSYTTIDLTLSYDTQDRTGSSLINNTVIGIGLLNALDQDPPFVENPFGSGVDIDARNANPLGRFVSFQITKRW